MPEWQKYALVAAGAAIGGMARFAVATTIARAASTRLPLGTMSVNLSGCFLIGLIMGALSAGHPGWRLFLVTGILGGYTTFSGFAWEIVDALRAGWWGVALANAAGSVAIGCAGVWLGTLLRLR